MMRSRNMQGLLPKYPLVMEGNEGVTMDQTSGMGPLEEGVIIIETEGEYSPPKKLAITNPIQPFMVEQPSSHDTSLHPYLEGYFGEVDWIFTQRRGDPVATMFGLAAPFWNTSLRHVISDFGTPPWSIMPISNEEVFGALNKTLSHIQESVRFRNFTYLPSTS